MPIPHKSPGVSTADNVTGQAVRGRGRGRGNIGIRGAAAPGVGRGAGAPPHGPAAGATNAGGAAGVAIMGAASKRTREEGEASTEDLLSKPATAAAATTATTTTAMTATADGAAGGSNTCGKPITLQRNRVQPS